MVKFDETAFRDVARAVALHNKYKPGEDNIYNRMVELAQLPVDGYITTAGFVLTRYTDSEGRLCIYPSVAHYLFSEEA